MKQTFSYMIMDRLGKDLDKIRKHALSKKFSLKTVLMIGK